MMSGNDIEAYANLWFLPACESPQAGPSPEGGVALGSDDYFNSQNTDSLPLSPVAQAQSYDPLNVPPEKLSMPGAASSMSSEAAQVFPYYMWGEQDTLPDFDTGAKRRRTDAYDASLLLPSPPFLTFEEGEATLAQGAQPMQQGPPPGGASLFEQDLGLPCLPDLPDTYYLPPELGPGDELYKLLQDAAQPSQPLTLPGEVWGTAPAAAAQSVEQMEQGLDSSELLIPPELPKSVAPAAFRSVSEPASAAAAASSSGPQNGGQRPTKLSELSDEAKSRLDSQYACSKQGTGPRLLLEAVQTAVSEAGKAGQLSVSNLGEWVDEIKKILDAARTSIDSQSQGTQGKKQALRLVKFFILFMEKIRTQLGSDTAGQTPALNTSHTLGILAKTMTAAEMKLVPAQRWGETFRYLNALLEEISYALAVYGPAVILQFRFEVSAEVAVDLASRTIKGSKRRGLPVLAPGKNDLAKINLLICDIGKRCNSAWKQLVNSSGVPVIGSEVPGEIQGRDVISDPAANCMIHLISFLLAHIEGKLHHKKNSQPVNDACMKTLIALFDKGEMPLDSFRVGKNASHLSEALNGIIDMLLTQLHACQLLEASKVLLITKLTGAAANRKIVLELQKHGVSSSELKDPIIQLMKMEPGQFQNPKQLAAGILEKQSEECSGNSITNAAWSLLNNILTEIRTEGFYTTPATGIKTVLIEDLRKTLSTASKLLTGTLVVEESEALGVRFGEVRLLPGSSNQWSEENKRLFWVGIISYAARARARARRQSADVSNEKLTAMKAMKREIQKGIYSGAKLVLDINWSEWTKPSASEIVPPKDFPKFVLPVADSQQALPVRTRRKRPQGGF